MRTSPRISACLVPIALLLAACSAADPAPTAEPADADDTPAASASASPDEPAMGPTSVRFRTSGLRLSAPLVQPELYYEDLRMPRRVHLLLKDAAADPTAQRWADLYVLAPTHVFDPVSQERRPMPADLVAWLQDHPRTDVLRTRPTRVNGHRAWQLDVSRDGSELFGDRDGGFDGDGLERFVLWQHGDRWLVAGGSTFRGKKGLLGPDEPDDALRALLDGLRVRRG